MPLKPNRQHYLFHGHCHQKALAGVDASLAVLKAIPDAQAEAIDAGCCGMAGAFGYTNDHYELSVAIANDRLLPAVQGRARRRHRRQRHLLPPPDQRTGRAAGRASGGGAGK